MGLISIGGGGIDYAFDIKDKKNLCAKIPIFKNQNYHSACHTKSLDIKAIELAIQMENVKLYALSEESPLVEFLSLAPLTKNDFHLENKPEGYVCDFMEFPIKNLMKEKFRVLFQISAIKKDNLFLKIFMDFAFCVRGFWRVIEFFLKK